LPETKPDKEKKRSPDKKKRRPFSKTSYGPKINRSDAFRRKAAKKGGCGVKGISVHAPSGEI